jgi:hydrogenase expression/formation protein HypE
MGGMDDRPPEFTLSCPVPMEDYPYVLLAHGGGGELMHRLLEELVLPAFSNPALDRRGDAAVLEAGGARLAFTTDSYVVRPLFFPGGDIGRLAVNGTVNDLAMAGARPLFLSAGLILEEGLPMEVLARVVQSMREAADAAGVAVVTGDTKVVERGRGDSLFVNTAGIGLVERGRELGPERVRPGDAILVNGDIGRHAMAIMAAREELLFETPIESDTAPVAGLVLNLLAAGITVRCLRDLTRGGLASALVEIAAAAEVGIEIEETALPVRPEVAAACEILGLDPVHGACEGRFVAFVAAEEAEAALALMREHRLGAGAAVLGRVRQRGEGVTLLSRLGVRRVVELLTGEQLPRIC